MILYPHQEQIIKAAYHKRAFAIFADCGLGKTACAIKLVESYQPCKALVIAPNTILENWANEVAKWSNLRAVILQGTRTKRVQLLDKPDIDVYIINYEALRLFEAELTAMKFDMIIADELQKLKGHKTLQSKAAFRLAQGIQYRLGMTGTPITNSPIDLFAEYRFLNPNIFGYSFYRFRARYAVMGGYMSKEIKAYINLDELKDKVHSIAITVKKEDCLSLPEKIYQVHRIDLHEEQRRVYKQLATEFISDIQGKTVTAPYVLTRLLRLSQCTAGFCKTEEHEEINFDTNPKLKLLRELIEDLPKEDKAVVFCRFLKEIRNLERLCEEANWPYTSVYGETKDRQTRIDWFNTTPEAKIFIGQVETAGIGINLQSAHYCVFLSNSYSHGSRIQCEERLHRIGQGSNVTYIDILAAKTIDETILNCLKEKKDLAEEIVNAVKIGITEGG